MPVVDVRSPGEYNKAHIPGAYNIPLFDNDQRKRVGIAYHQHGRQEAVMEGLRIVGPRMESLADEARNLAGDQRSLVVHCWRGGMRSESMAWLFDKLGLVTYVLKGGYKAYRRYCRPMLKQPACIIVLGGYTGSGKTDILKSLKEQGQQVLDLEGLACHKGSAFGSMGQKEQPSTEHFENRLFDEWLKMDLERPVWIEDESKMIGKCGIPDELFHAMRRAPVVKIELDRSLRVERLVEEYAVFDREKLKGAISRIRKRLGGDRARQAMEAVDEGDFHSAADISLDYYDKAYLHGLGKRDPSRIHSLAIDRDDPNHTARLLIEKAFHFQPS